MRIEIDTNGLFNKILWLVISGAILFSAKKVNDMSNNIAELNYKMGTVMIWQVTKDKTLEDHETRIRKIEGVN